MQGDLELQLDETISSPEDEERVRVREEYRQRLAEKLKDPEFRKIEGFPIGTDEAILALSDPPYYTACPNPFIKEWLQQNAKPYDSETDNYHCEPFATDVSEGKTDPVYNIHSYHTKVPHKAIMRYILHYTAPGDIVFDGFCGSGMTGVAAWMCGNVTEVASLGVYLSDDQPPEKPIAVGRRHAILCDLSPAATFITRNYNAPLPPTAFGIASRAMIQSAEKEFSWMHTAIHLGDEAAMHQLARSIDLALNDTDASRIINDLWDIERQHSGIVIGLVNYTVWSDVFICPACGGDIIFFDAAIDTATGSVRDSFSCTKCTATISKRDLQRKKETVVIPGTGKAVMRAVQVPVLKNYTASGKRLTKRCDEFDQSISDACARQPIDGFYPTNSIEKDIDIWYERDYRSIGVYSIDAFFTPRNLKVLSWLFQRARNITDTDTRLACLFALTGVLQIASRMSSFRFDSRNPNNTAGGILKGAMYIPSLSKEARVAELLTRKVRQIQTAMPIRGLRDSYIISTQSTTSLPQIPDAIVDYIFIDPPFGSNIIYSDLSLLWESWLKVLTATADEAVIHRRKKNSPTTLDGYQELMTACFRECYRMLKPGRWMTVEFHNTATGVWHAIQEALQKAGFIIADVRILSKKQRSFKQVTTSAAALEDLVMSCYRPHPQFEEQFCKVSGAPEGAWEFVRQHLEMLPVVLVSENGNIEILAERTKYLLFDRMVAYHLQHGARIPMSATEFYEMLDREFSPIDEMYFLPDQRARYDAVRSRTGVETQELFISDERSAVHWVRRQLLQKNMTLGELTPAFMQELHNWASHEERPELRDILKVNFIPDEDIKWRVPDPSQERDIEALRRKALLKTFEGYVKSKGQLKVFRKEAIIEGFKHCWQTKQYGVIVAVCESIPMKILREVPEFVQFYDIAKDLAPVETQQLEFSWEG